MCATVLSTSSDVSRISCVIVQRHSMWFGLQWKKKWWLSDRCHGKLLFDRNPSSFTTKKEKNTTELRHMRDITKLMCLQYAESERTHSHTYLDSKANFDFKQLLLRFTSFRLTGCEWVWVSVRGSLIALDFYWEMNLISKKIWNDFFFLNIEIWYPIYIKFDALELHDSSNNTILCSVAATAVRRRRIAWREQWPEMRAHAYCVAYTYCRLTTDDRNVCALLKIETHEWVHVRRFTINIRWRDRCAAHTTKKTVEIRIGLLWYDELVILSHFWDFSSAFRNFYQTMVTIRMFRTHRRPISPCASTKITLFYFDFVYGTKTGQAPITFHT